MNSKEIMEKVVGIMDSKKASDIKALDISSVTTMADYFVICQGNSGTQMKAIAEEIEEKLSEQGINPIGREGMSTAYWILMDYSEVIVHIFNSESRGFYSIENLWSDATEVDISSIVTED
ncbi:MAG: ribosome silencing factor [Ruminococcaceae bacterium]|nr:ribosome silencing factor [Oscillospiraceae bacterium]